MNWRELSPSELEREYTPSSRVENIQVYLDEYANLGSDARQKIDHEKLEYGDHQDEWLWLATNKANVAPRKLIVFVHGGFWRRLSADDGTFLTTGWHLLGYDCASVNYSLCPTETLETLVEQTTRALEFLSKSYNTANTLLIGHSAGAHLIAMALTRANRSRYAGAIFVSGIFELSPIVNTSVNNAVQLDEQTAKQMSPINFVAQTADTPTAIIWGENETDEFKRQSRDFAKAWDEVDSHSPTKSKEIIGRNHFDILHELAKQNVIDLPSA